MLTVYRSNRADLLAQLLGEHLLQTPPDPFETVAVVVNTWPTSRWLGEQLALKLGGIAANIRFPFPGSHLRALVQHLLEEEGEGSDPWRATDLVWPVLELLPQLVEAPEAAPLRRWLECRDEGGELDAPLWQLARAIADALDDLSLYRPAMAQAWWQGGSGDSLGDPLPEALRWQPLLVQLLRDRLQRKPFGLRMLELIERLRQGRISGVGIPAPLRLFGLSSAPPVQVQLLQALALVVPVEIYLLTPCADLWQRCIERRRELQDALALEQPFGLDWLLKTPGLEARFGRLGGEYQQLLEGTGEWQLGSGEERDLFLLPATAAAAAQRRASLLEQIQEQLAQPAAQQPLQRAADDHSLEFHPCPGTLRQVQIVRDRVLQLLAADPSLEPRHILVMTPQVDRLRPPGGLGVRRQHATGVELPWRLTDRSQQSDTGHRPHPAPALLELAGERLTASGLEGLLEHPSAEALRPGRRRPPPSPGELQRCGFRWGLDGGERAAAHPQPELGDRSAAAGAGAARQPGLAPGDTAPMAPRRHSREPGGAGCTAAHQPQQPWLQLRRSRPAATGAPASGPCSRTCSAMAASGLGMADDAGQAIDDWSEGASGCSAGGPAMVVAAVLHERLSADSGRFGHRSGALTISALEPMRAIPYRVIVLMGLDAEVFPRRASDPASILMEHGRRWGIPARPTRTATCCWRHCSRPAIIC
jgi:exodeoxyribonuclease V gamma subunit